MGQSWIVSIGDELLAGRILDTNARHLSRRLREEGFPVVGRETVGDDVPAIAAALRRAWAQAPIVIACGGLGPTADDVTRDGVAAALGVPLAPHEGAEALVRAFFDRGGRAMTEANRIQAVLPVGTLPIPNARGTAPGIWAELGERCLAVLPGVPHELIGMMDEEVLPRLRTRPDRAATPALRRLTIAGLPESEMGERLKELMTRGRNPSVGSYPAMGEITLVLEAREEGGVTADELLDRDVRLIRERLGESLAADDGSTVAAVLARELLRRRLTIAVAESITGGRIADLLVANPGISASFLAGIVAYGDAQKSNLLGVDPLMIAAEGAVSEACCRAMAEGVRRRTGAALAIATTGIAGPSGAVPGKPVGTVFLGVASDAGTEVQLRNILGDRPQIQERAAIFALDLLRRHVLRHALGVS